MSTKFALQKILKGIFLTEEKNKPMNKVPGKNKQQEADS